MTRASDSETPAGVRSTTRETDCMHSRVKYYLLRPARPLAVLTAAFLLLITATPALGDEGTIRIESSSITSEFPEGFRLKVKASGDNDIKSVAVRLKIGQQTSGVYNYLKAPGGEDLEPGKAVDGELFWRTNTAPRYIPPGTIFTYSFEVEDSEGTLFETEKEEFVYYDARFEWKEVSEGPVSVAYHGPVQSRARIVLDSIIETLGKIGPILGAETEGPIRVTMYNNVKEMLEALPRGSSTIRRELITEGQAFTDTGTLLVLGGGRLAKGTASHEVTHILVHRAGDSIFRSVPAWLNEGLAEYGNIEPGFSYDVALQFAIGTNRVLPVMFMRALPGDPEDVIVFYGQARSIVQLMVREFGPEKMTELMAVLKSGKNMDDALKEVYGLDRLQLDAMWRQSIRAPEYIPPESGRAIPTPLPAPKVLPYSLTPHPQSETVAARSDEPTPTPEPEATHTPTPAPTPQPAAAAIDAAASPTPATDTQAGASGSSCNPASGAMDLTVGALLLGLVGLGFRRRIRL